MDDSRRSGARSLTRRKRPNVRTSERPNGRTVERSSGKERRRVLKRFKTRRRASFRRFATAKKTLKIFSEIFFFVPRLPFSVENKRVAILERSVEKEKKERFGGLAPRLPNCGRTPEERDALGGVRIPCPFLRQVVFDSSRSKGFFLFLTNFLDGGLSGGLCGGFSGGLGGCLGEFLCRRY